MIQFDFFKLSEFSRLLKSKFGKIFRLKKWIFFLKFYLAIFDHNLTIRQWSIIIWLFQVWMNDNLNNNTMKCKKIATIVSGRKHVTRPFVRRKQVCNVRCCYILAPVLICFLPDERPSYFWPETILASFLYLMVLLFIVLFKHNLTNILTTSV